MGATLIAQDNEISFETKIGQLIINKDEYLIINEDGRADKLMITKKGIQKIEDFFQIEIEQPIINQAFVNNANFNIIVTINATSPYGSAYAVASANRFNLTNAISCAYGTEMAVKRARATAALEILRKNCTNTETLLLLYSDFDEFRAERTVNNSSPNDEINNTSGNTEIENNTNKNTQKNTAKQNNTTKQNTSSNTTTISESKSTTNVDDKNKKNNTSKQSKENPPSEKGDSTNGSNPKYTEEDFQKPIVTKKYLEGITISEILEKDKDYFKMMIEQPNPRRDFAIAYLESLGKTFADI